MAQRIFQQAYHVSGALGADLNIRFTAPFDCTLLHVSAVNSTAYAAGLTIGDSSDADEYLTKSNIGVSNTPVEFDGDDFVDTSGNTHHLYYPRIADGTVVVIALDYNYNGGGSAQASADVTIVLTFAEG
jgi:hypothetical protein